MVEAHERTEAAMGGDDVDERQPLLSLTKSNDPAIKHHLPQHWSLAYRWGIVGLLAFMAFTVYDFARQPSPKDKLTAASQDFHLHIRSPSRKHHRRLPQPWPGNKVEQRPPRHNLGTRRSRRSSLHRPAI